MNQGSVLVYCNGEAVMARWIGGPDCLVECRCGTVLRVVDTGDFDRGDHSFDGLARVYAFQADPRD